MAKLKDYEGTPLPQWGLGVLFVGDKGMLAADYGRRYLLPKLGAMNFVLDEVLDGGVNDALNLDMHGKTLSFHLLTLPITVPEDKA